MNRNNTREKWLDAGLQVLAAEGAGGLRIDRIAARLKLSKGSFHHHFSGADGYKRELLALVEAMAVDALEQQIDAARAPGDARALLTQLTQLVAGGKADIYRPELELAVRAWASWDDEVNRVQGRIDRARLMALQRIWRPHVATDSDARVAALLPYLVALGAAVSVPPVGPEELGRVYEMLLPLVPEPRT
ncbi:TetR/AcrR family transcriptional regulator [Mycolicibacterium gadium]|uniref:TetR/AcrR family transcriptional regulator n=1 Tax=Mycolicibacterium gadium TaxID=1794 RepID=A0ABT6GVU6_MYCGU|nr:TetR/AcrR family transcriptional regulator [Mycolicibacterium gadium]MDG5485368.1 TetR/AcrR family transcriptional regulator [Mycolicibacterium gadium]